MTSLWIVNKCCGGLHQKLYGKKATGGQWLDAMLEEARQSGDRVVVVNIEKAPKLAHYEDGNISFYTLQGEPNAKYDYRSASTQQVWKEIIEKEQPDVIELWGTEFPYGLAALDVAPQLPAVIYVQGILDSIGKYYLSGLTDSELKQARTLRDVVTGTTIRQTKKQFERRAQYEAELVRRAGHIIIENEWAASYYKKIYPEVGVHYLPISISESFRNQRWSEDTMQPHTIMCSAADYPIKGLHMLLKALRIVKQAYPDVKLFVPGTPLRAATSLKMKIKQRGYDRLITHMIADYGLQDAVTYTGRLTADEMAKKMAEINCFVMCSAIENHSSTLKEAMTVGTPCVASYVGGVPEYATSGENCLLYRFEDYEMLAQHICRIFRDNRLRNHLLQQTVQGVVKRKRTSDYEAMKVIFDRVVNEILFLKRGNQDAGLFG